MEIDHEVTSTAILPLLLVQEGQLSYIDESMYTRTSSLPRGLSLPRSSVSRLTDHSQHDPNVDWAVKLQLRQTNSCKNGLKWNKFIKFTYDKCPKNSYTSVADKMAYANSADPDQTAPKGAVWSGSILFAIPLSSLRDNSIKSKI